jgi:hypothetical protein
MLTEHEFNLYYDAILSEIEPRLVGPRVIVRAESLPRGTQSITLHELKKLKGKALMGSKGEDIPREVAEMDKKTVKVIEHAYGFELHDQDLASSRRAKIPLQTTAARQCGRVVAESIERMIFNGIPELGIEGIYTSAPQTYTVTNAWNTTNGDPHDDVLQMVSMLEGTSPYEPKFMILSRDAYRMLSKVNKMGISYMSMIEDAEIFPNGRKDIYKAPAPANREADPIIPPGCGLIGDYGSTVAQRFVQQTQAERLSGEEEHYVDIYLEDFPKNANNMWLFNVLTYQGLGIHFKDAFLKLEGLTKTPEKVTIKESPSKKTE